MRLLMFFMLIATIFAFGCAEDIEEDMEIEMEVEVPRTSLEKAQGSMQQVNDRRADVFQKAEASDDFSVLFAAAEEIFQEELGFEKEFWQDLVMIWEEIQIEKFQAGELDEAVAQRYENFFKYPPRKIS